MFSIVLFFNEVPVGYMIEQVGEGIYFTPGSYSKAKGSFPAFRLSQENDTWKFDIVLDEGIQEQVLLSLNHFERGNLMKVISFVES